MLIVCVLCTFHERPKDNGTGVVNQDVELAAERSPKGLVNRCNQLVGPFDGAEVGSNLQSRRRPPALDNPVTRINTTQNQRLPQTAGGQQNLTGEPSGGWRGQEHRDWRDVIRLAKAAQRRLRDHLLREVASDYATAMSPLGFHATRIDRVDADFLRAQLFRQDSRYCIDGAFGRGINNGVRRSRGRRHRAYVDNASSVVPKVLDRLARSENYPQHVGVEMAVKFIFGDRFQWRKLVNTGVVDQYVERAECLLGLFEEALHVSGFGDVALNRDRLAAVLFDLVDDALRVGFAGPIIHNHGRPSLSQTFGNSCSDPLGRAGYDCDFPLQITHSHPSNSNIVTARRVPYPAGQDGQREVHALFGYPIRSITPASDSSHLSIGPISYCDHRHRWATAIAL